MMKILKYFLQSIIVYFFFLIIKILGIKISRKVFPSFFKIMGPLIRSNKIIIQNLEKILKSPENKNQIIKNLWKNYALIFVEYNYKKRELGKGSCIFIHLTKDYKATEGCIALRKNDFLIMLKLLNKKTKIKIY